MFRYVLSGLTGFLLISQNHKKHCLTIDCSYQNKNRSSVDNPVEQVFYFNKRNDGKYYIFTSKRIKEEGYDNGIYFKMEKARGRTDRKNFDAKKH